MKKSFLILLFIYVSNFSFGQQISVLNGELKYRVSPSTIKTAADKSVFQSKIDALNSRIIADSTSKVYGLSLKENSLGSPSINGYILSSTTGGIRSWIAPPSGGGGGSVAWSGITGTLSNQTDLQSALNLKANLISPTLVSPALGVASATSLNASGTVTGSNLSGTNTGDNAVNTNYSNDFRAANFIAGTNYLAPNGSASGLTSFPTLNQNTTGNAATVTTNANLTGVVTSIGNATSIANGAIGNAMLANSAVSNLSGTNTGDNAVNSLYSSLATNATHTGDATGATILTLATVNSNVGSFGTVSNVPTLSVNGKGLVTSVSNTAIQLGQSQVTNLVSDLNLKANLASPTFSGTVGGITKSMVGLGSSDNTTDLDKPISTLTQTALNLKENSLGNPPTNGHILSSTTGGIRSWIAPPSGGGGGSWGSITGTLSDQTDLQNALNLKANIATPTFTTSATVPLLIGGTTTTSSLNLQTTSATGATGADMNFRVGTNGATTAMQIKNNGNILAGSTTDAGERLQITGTSRFTGAVNIASGTYNFAPNGILGAIYVNWDGSGFGSSTNGALINFSTNNLILGKNANSVVVNGTTAAASAIFDVQSTTKGFMPPRMTSTQRNAIASPATGLLVYDTTLGRTMTHDGTSWGTIGSLSGSYTTTGTATTTYTVTIGATMPNTAYRVNITPSNALSATDYFYTNKTSTTFDVVYLSGLTGTVAFDWAVFR